MAQQIKVGDKVNYDSENGIVKFTDNEYSWVVFKCGGNWDRYFDYTASRCNNSKLLIGWKDEKTI